MTLSKYCNVLTLKSADNFPKIAMGWVLAQPTSPQCKTPQWFWPNCSLVFHPSDISQFLFQVVFNISCKFFNSNNVIFYYWIYQYIQYIYLSTMKHLPISPMATWSTFLVVFITEQKLHAKIFHPKTLLQTMTYYTLWGNANYITCKGIPK